MMEKNILAQKGTPWLQGAPGGPGPWDPWVKMVKNHPRTGTVGDFDLISLAKM